MVICKFFQEGRCKYGINCRFEHSSYGKWYLFVQHLIRNRFDEILSKCFK